MSPLHAWQTKVAANPYNSFVGVNLRRILSAHVGGGDRGSFGDRFDGSFNFGGGGGDRFGFSGGFGDLGLPGGIRTQIGTYIYSLWQE